MKTVKVTVEVRDSVGEVELVRTKVLRLDDESAEGLLEDIVEAEGRRRRGW